MPAEGRDYDLHPLDMPFSSKCWALSKGKLQKLPSINEEDFFIDRSKSSMWQRLCLVISRKPIHEQLFVAKNHHSVASTYAGFLQDQHNRGTKLT